MKNILSILAVFFTFLSTQAQDSAEKRLFYDINIHRDSMGIAELKFDSLAYKAAKHHADYLAIINNSKYRAGLMTHDEKIDVEDFQEYDAYDRLDFFIPKNKGTVENVAGGAIPNPLGKKIVTVKDSVISKVILNMWINSKGHKKNLEIKNCTMGACAITVVSSDITINTPNGSKIRTFVSYYAVFVAYY